MRVLFKKGVAKFVKTKLKIRGSSFEESKKKKLWSMGCLPFDSL